MRSDGAELAGRMRVGGNKAPRLLFARVRAPELREREEEPLLRREAIDHLTLGRVLGQRALQGFVSDGNAAEVRDVFAERQLAVDLEAGERFIGTVLIHQLLRARLELFRVRLRPPVLQ